MLSAGVYRGSRKHILDWVEQTDFRAQLNRMLKSAGAMVAAEDQWQPLGYQRPNEARLDHFGAQELPEAINWNELTNWWLIHARGANTPNWDLLSTCTLNGRKGLVLIEAKANVSEIKREGKIIKNNAYNNSHDNHKRIKMAIEEARTELDKVINGVKISRDCCYQLSNRVAFSWKLSSLGLPVVLVYLGFTGDTGIENVGERLRDHAHWKKVMDEYASLVLPQGFCDHIINCDRADMRMIICSRPIIEVSPTKMTRHKL
jgi:hypothetical protein